MKKDTKKQTKIRAPSIPPLTKEQESLLKKLQRNWDESQDTIHLRPISEYTAREFTFIFLMLAATGVLFSAILVAPNIGIIYKLFEAKDSNDRRRIVRAVRKYKRRKLIITKNGMVYTSAEGGRILDTYKARNLYFKKPNTWKGSWLAVTFDIPSTYENERKILREKLDDFGFKQYQDSLFVSPHDCKSLVEELCTLLAITPHVKYLHISSLTDEEQLKKYFKLK